MNLDYPRIAIVLIILLALCAGAIVLQFFLSKKESKWAGLILPITTFVISLIYVFNVANIGEQSTVIMTVIFTFLLCNIPTAVLLAIYTACRGKRKRQRALEKMSVQDLE